MSTTSETTQETIGDQRQIPFVATARSVFLGWEKLRVVYVLLLAGWCLGLFVVSQEDVDAAKYWYLSLLGGIVANLCYFAGPLVEGYVAWLGWQQHRFLRPILFGLGLFFTMVLALGVHARNLFPGFD